MTKQSTPFLTIVIIFISLTFVLSPSFAQELGKTLQQAQEEQALYKKAEKEADKKSKGSFSRCLACKDKCAEALLTNSRSALSPQGLESCVDKCPQPYVESCRRLQDFLKIPPPTATIIVRPFYGLYGRHSPFFWYGY